MTRRTLLLAQTTQNSGLAFAFGPAFNSSPLGFISVGTLIGWEGGGRVIADGGAAMYPGCGGVLYPCEGGGGVPYCPPPGGWNRRASAACPLYAPPLPGPPLGSLGSLTSVL